MLASWPSLGDKATARDLIANAFAHTKFIAYIDAARPLLDKAGMVPAPAAS